MCVFYALIPCFVCVAEAQSNLDRNRHETLHKSHSKSTNPNPAPSRGTKNERGRRTIFVPSRANTLNPAMWPTNVAGRGKMVGGGGLLQTVSIELNNCGIIIKTRNGPIGNGHGQTRRLCACNVQRVAWPALRDLWATLSMLYIERQILIRKRNIRRGRIHALICCTFNTQK